jgi:fluoroquinolone transport system ATP-binding protein
MIDVQNLSFSYTSKPFIEHTSFSVQKAEIFGLLGPSGAGKSTMQKILIGLLTQYSGSVRVLDTEVKKHKNSFYERIGIDFEFPALYEKLTARQNLRFFGSLYAGKLRDMDTLLEKVELLADADKQVSEYSKGMKSRLGFIKALLHDPAVLFLDEPTAGLDPANSRILKDIILEEKARGKAIILTTHNMQDAYELCDRVAFIVGGAIKALDTPRHLIMRGGAKKIVYSYMERETECYGECVLQKTGGDALLNRLIADGALVSIHSCEPTLGDVFMEVTGRLLT